MANLIIKPTSGGSLILQDEGGDAALTVGTTGSTTLAGTANSLGTVTAGNISNSAIVYPSGHVINKKLLANENDQVGHLSTTSTSYVDSGIFAAYTPLKSSSVTWLNVHYHTGILQAQANTTNTDCTMDDANSTSWVLGNSMGGDSYSNQDTGSNNAPTYNWVFNTVASGLVQADSPTNQTSYVAGTPYYFRIYVKISGGTYYYVHDGGYYNFYIEEIML